VPTTTPLTTTHGWSKQRRPSRNAIKGLIEGGAPLVGITEADLKTAGGRDPYPITDEGRSCTGYSRRFPASRAGCSCSTTRRRTSRRYNERSPRGSARPRRCAPRISAASPPVLALRACVSLRPPSCLHWFQTGRRSRLERLGEIEGQAVRIVQDRSVMGRKKLLQLGATLFEVRNGLPRYYQVSSSFSAVLKNFLLAQPG
jgi:hypothetical protein